MPDSVDPRRVTHTIAPVMDARCRVLVLGTMPSPRSREVGFYYGNPQNRFWPVLAGLWGEPVPGEDVARAHGVALSRAAMDPNLVGEVNGERRDLCLAHHVALWDVLRSCTITGASDASIADAVPNDLAGLLARAPITSVFCTGATATRLYRRLVEPGLGMPCVGLPSTSPANARMRLCDLVCAYGPVRDAADA
ncbi:MAG: uracil-DNA glycosylase family protein [Atopobiaceae bacterium]|nr:uracil-DNA glycosylase family protein [Atopobiaceae bacterium]MCH4214617.1 uracil-DNA glycosylase family protein [Atopobiaceae bacterium]MCH4230498.1 uracil-DNA glycosylase family protein [Atopobiaceae bacterium]MCH4275788.1 uracil-DNA glycosylase family protein [Atopobiaceae bacterium]MDD2587754.1 uracil-DNA glycosylase family protein [Atopobiaceae bacterium]